MDLSRGLLRVRALGWLPARARALSPDAALGPARALLAHERARRWLKGLGLLATSALLGTWAYDGAYAEAIHAWERRHPPGLAVWEHALGARGLKPPGQRSRQGQAARSLPARLEPQGTAWVSGDANWVAVFGPPEAESPFKLYCRDCDRPVQGWDSPGTGWTGFERVLERIDRLPRQTPRAAIQSPRDSREIVY